MTNTPPADPRPRPAYGEYAEAAGTPVPAGPHAGGEGVEPSAPPMTAPPAAYGEFVAPGSPPPTSAPVPVPVPVPVPPAAYEQGYPTYTPGPAPAGPERTGLGMVAMIVAIGVFVLSAIAATLIGVGEGGLMKAAGATLTDPTVGDSADTAAAATFGLAIIAHIFLGTAFGVWGLVQGIVAVVKRRGRAFGIVAICFAGAAPVVSLILYAIGIGTQVPR